MADKVTVESLEWHTHDGKAYDVGDTYSVDEALADSLKVQGKAVRVDRVAVAKRAEKVAAKPAKAVKSVKKARRGKR